MKINMKKAIQQLLIVGLLICQIGTAAFSQKTRQMEREKNSTAEKRLALVIGNGAYRNASSLDNPVNDATDMAATLKDLGFEVISGTNLTKAQMDKLIRDFGNRLAETKAVGLFFYAGHGIAQNGTNYLIPIDADIQAEDEIEYSSVSINFVLGKMAAANNGFNMVILDACRNNPFARKWRNYRDTGDKGGLTRIDAPTGTLIAYATKPGDVASDGNGRNGLYTGALLKQMRIKNVDITKMFQLVRADVIKQSNGKQVPFDESSVVGDFYFGGLDKTVVTQNSVNSSANSKTGEETFWRTIENSTEERDFENYIARSERGEFAGTYKASAELKLFRLKKDKAAATWVRLSSTAKLLLKYEFVDIFLEGLSLVQVGKSTEFLNTQGNKVIDERNIRYGFIDRSGREIIPAKYYRALRFSDGLARVGAEDGHYFIDKNNNKYDLIPSKYSNEPDDLMNGYSFTDGLLKVYIVNSQKEEKWGFIGKNGQETIALKYAYVESFSEGLALAVETNKGGFIDKTGKEIIPFKYDYAFSFSEGLAAVARLGDDKILKWGFIDKTGKEIIPLKYDYAFSFSDGLAQVRIGNENTGKWSFIDKTGKEIIPPRDNIAFEFKDGLAMLRIGNKFGFIDKTGKEVIPIKYDEIWCLAFQKDGIIGVILDGRKGFVDIYGNEYFDF
jgi:hypothetical protein